MRLTRQVWSLVLTTIGAAVLSAMITGSSYLSMILPGRPPGAHLQEEGPGRQEPVAHHRGERRRSSCRSSPGAWPASTSPGPWASRPSPTCPGPS
ncbi:MAG: hypothetical protein MZV64_33685 [Ignavibacteriales bacterium]|nr:hypothetical protein [Ignavibacteriales bacterium]